jgi:hypothetical protein
MSARIQVTGGMAHAAEYRIQGEVVRIGSDPASEVVVPEAPRHWLVLQFRDGEFLIHDRAKEPFLLGNRVVPAGSPPIVWPAREPVRVRNVALHLYCDDGAAPGPLSSAEKSELSAEEMLAPSAGEDRRRAGVSAGQVAILLACGLLIGLMLLDLASSSAPRPQPQFDELIERLSAGARSGDGEAAGLLDMLQQGRYYEGRRDFAAAKRCYGCARDVVLARRAADGAFSQPSDQDIYDFLARRLQHVESRVPSDLFSCSGG